MDDKLVLKNRLKEIRTEKGMSIETGQFSPTAKLALILCIALDRKFEDVFFF